MMRVILCSIGLLSALIWASAQSFTYQGFLRQNGNPANGNYDFQFLLFTALTGGTQVGSTVSLNSVSVQNGLFTVVLDFGAVWDGSDRFLEIRVRPTGGTGYTILEPRVKINPTPYAIRANTAGTANPIGSAGGDLSGSYPNPTVARLQGRSVANTAPTTGQVLKWNGSAWSPANEIWSQSGTNIFYNTGNVGIGTNSPFAPLSLGGGNADTKLALWQGNNAEEVMGFGIAPNQFRLHLHHPGNRFSFLNAPNGVEILTIYGSGDLQLANDRSITGLDQLVGYNDLRLYGDASGGPDLFIAANGNVGVGTTSPSFQLHVETNAGDRAIFGYHSATTDTTAGVFGRSQSPNGRGVWGWASATGGSTCGVYGVSDSPNGAGVVGWATPGSGMNYGVFGRSDSPSGYGVYSLGNFAALGTKSFQIDHPLHPETHYLNHFCTEAPEPLNAYSGNVVTDGRGYAVVQLPDYFETINRDFRYQLTVIDGAGEEFVQVRVVRKIQNNQFVIRTSKPFVEISWRVEAIRNDRWVQEYGYQTEQEKPQEHQGKYLHPELYGQPKEKGIHYRPDKPSPVEAEPARPNNR